METNTVKKAVLQKIVKQSVKKAIIEDIRKLNTVLIPTIKKTEMNDITKRYKRNRKSREKKFIDLTDWVITGF